MNKIAAKKRLAKLVDLKSLPKNQARVEIAKDVLAALALNKFSSVGGYVTAFFEKSFKERKEETSLREELPKMQACNVCALGGLFVAQVARENNFDVNTYEGYIDLGEEEVKDQLCQFFDWEAMEKIERWFECWPSFQDCSMEWLCKTRLDKMRLIMQNIIDNDGTFRPELL